MSVLKSYTTYNTIYTTYLCSFSALFTLKCLVIKYLLKIMTTKYQLLTILCIYMINKRECEVIQFISQSQVINQ